MNWKILRRNWEQFEGVIKEQWGWHTDDPVDEFARKQDELKGKVGEGYGETKDGAKNLVRQPSEHGKMQRAPGKAFHAESHRRHARGTRTLHAAVFLL